MKYIDVQVFNVITLLFQKCYRGGFVSVIVTIAGLNCCFLTL